MYTIATLTTLLAAALAAPAVEIRDTLPNVNISLSNDFTGANVGTKVYFDSINHYFRDLFANSKLVKDGRVIATSLQTTTTITQGRCTVNNEHGRQIGDALTAQHTYLDLDGNPSVANQTDVTYFYIRCES